MMTLSDKPLCLDLFSGAGGCARGYQMAGFYVVGVDIKPQKRYVGDDFLVGDALEVLRRLIDGGSIVGNRVYRLENFSLIHASPPCQGYSVTIHIHKNSSKKKSHPKLIEPTRELLQTTGKPYVIENVPGAPLNGNLLLCGTMFGLRVIRHRIFETYPQDIYAPSTCNHWGHTMGNNAKVKNRGVVQSFELAPFLTISGHDYKLSDGQVAMSIDWMTRDELNESIPPAYTHYIGRQMLELIKELNS